MAEFTRTLAGDKVVYTNKTLGRQVDEKDLAPELKEELDIAEPGTVIDDETIEKLGGDGRTDADGNPIVDKPAKKDEKPSKPAAKPAAEEEDDEPSADTNPYRRPVETSEKGFGFPRYKGKTADIFDGKTPHTHLRLVSGLTVPLSEKSYNTKSDAEIHDRLVELKLV